VAGAVKIVGEPNRPVEIFERDELVRQADEFLKGRGLSVEQRGAVIDESAEGLIFNIDGLSAPSEVMNYALRPEQLSTAHLWWMRYAAFFAELQYIAGLPSFCCSLTNLEECFKLWQDDAYNVGLHEFASCRVRAFRDLLKHLSRPPRRSSIRPTC
jgi:hypothetical protein